MLAASIADDDLRLLANSPVIDAADNTALRVDRSIIGGACWGDGAALAQSGAAGFGNGVADSGDARSHGLLFVH